VTSGRKKKGEQESESVSGSRVGLLGPCRAVKKEREEGAAPGPGEEGSPDHPTAYFFLVLLVFLFCCFKTLNKPEF
jgi:hypothetical protein